MRDRRGPALDAASSTAAPGGADQALGGVNGGDGSAGIELDGGAVPQIADNNNGGGGAGFIVVFSTPQLNNNPTVSPASTSP